MKFSLIIPVYNRPDEIKELLESLQEQTYKNFEVIVVEDGSTMKCEEICNTFDKILDLRYFFKPNSGQGFTRNYAFERATGEYLIVFDSDCIIPAHYLQTVNDSLNANWLDAFGGPDRAHESFTDIQKAISYSMTSVFTTGGIRGNKKHVGQFHPRSFNMGISREVWEKTHGYIITRKGEDIEFSIYIHSLGFRIGLIEEAHVYHKRRTDFRQFFKQLHFFGTARINVYRFHKSELKAVHFFPAVFTAGLGLTLLSILLGTLSFGFMLFCYTLYSMLILIDASVKFNSLRMGWLSLCAAYIQLTGYGLGFISEGWKELTGVGVKQVVLKR